MKSRIAKLTAKLGEVGIDAMIITSWENLYYLTGIMTMQSRSKVVDPMPLLLSKEGNVHFFPTVAFYSAVQIEHREIPEATPYDVGELWAKVALALQRLKLSSGRIGLEFRTLSKYHFDKFQSENPTACPKDCTDLLDDLRMTKDTDEITKLRRACSVTDKILELAPQEILRVGRTEMEAAGEIIRLCTELGAEGSSFHPQVVSGKRSSLLNVSSSYEKKIKRNDIVLLDFGVNYQGYCSDTARAFVIGHPKPTHKKIAQAVHEIMATALSSVEAGAKASEVHEAALSKFRQFGFEGMCRHSSGHGIGLSVWEKPLLREFDSTTLEEHTTLAVEQGIYLHNFGIRFEQNLEVRENGYLPFFKYPMELVSI
jgi:Xaa-Pro aminopeptidase